MNPDLDVVPGRPNSAVRWGGRSSRYPLALLIALLLSWSGLAFWEASAQLPQPYSTIVQVNVDAEGHNLPGDAANEPSLCVDPLNPSRVAIGWRQFDSASNNFRQAGWGFSTNAGRTWTFPGVLEPGTFRSDPVLAADADGTFYYLGVLDNGNLYCDLWRSTNGGMSWELAGPALGGDKPWLVADRSMSPARGTLYQVWSPYFNFANNDPTQMFSRSFDKGQTWPSATALPGTPFWGTLDVGPRGELYSLGWDGLSFWLDRSTNASNSNASLAFDLTTRLDLGGALVYGSVINPVGLLGQPWIAVDRSSNATCGNVYALCSVSRSMNPADVMFARSTNGGFNWSAPLRLNDDEPSTNAYHWFGTLAVAPNGRLDACWNDTRNDPSNHLSQLYYAYSEDGGLTWSANAPVSGPFDHTLGYPAQEKMGDYIGMVSLEGAAMVAFTATFNGEQDVWFATIELPLKLNLSLSNNLVRLSWNTVPGRMYCVQAKDELSASWSTARTVGCVTSPGTLATLSDPVAPAGASRFYRLLEPHE